MESVIGANDYGYCLTMESLCVRAVVLVGLTGCNLSFLLLVVFILRECYA